MPFSAALFRRARCRLAWQGSLRGFFRRGMTQNTSETVASTESTASSGGGIDAEKRSHDRGSNRFVESSGDSGDSTPSIVAIADGDGAAGVRRVMPVEEPRHDPRAVGAVVNGIAQGVTRSMHADESLRAPVVASQEDIVLAEQLRLALERRYLNEPR